MPDRQSIRLQGYDYSASGYYFVTICTHHRNKIFGMINVHDVVTLNDWGDIVRDEWLKTPTIRPQITLDEFIIMPDHLHGIITVGAPRWGAQNTRWGAQNTRWGGQNIRLGSDDNQYDDDCFGRAGGNHGHTIGNQGQANGLPLHAYFQRNLIAIIISQFKSMVTKRVRMISGNEPIQIWQRGYHDHIIRNEQELHAIREYIRNNPKN